MIRSSADQYLLRMGRKRKFSHPEISLPEDPHTSLTPFTDPDILLPLGPDSLGGKHMELKFTLRSLAEHGRGWRKIWIVGQRPDWLVEDDRLVHVPVGEAEGNHEWRIAAKLIWSFENIGEMSDYAVLWNDDYFLTRDIDLQRLKFFASGTLGQRIGRRQRGDRYCRALQRTDSMLNKFGLSTHHFDIHAPIIYERVRFLALRDFWNYCQTAECGLVVKSVYGNCWGIKPEQMLDMKLSRNWESMLPEVEKRWILSYGDHALNTGIHYWFQHLLPERSQWEA